MIPIRPHQQLTSFLLSPEQRTVVDWRVNGEGNVIVEAVAGSGKTSTLVAFCGDIPREQRSLFAVFNKKIATEIGQKVRIFKSVEARTFHSIGFNATVRHYPGLIVDKNEKTRRMNVEAGVPFHLRSAVVKLVNLGKQNLAGIKWPIDDESYWRELIQSYNVLLRVDVVKGITDEEHEEQIVEHAIRGLKWSNSTLHSIIDFDDMVYAPLLLDLNVNKYPWILADECQDINAGRLMLVEKMMATDSRCVFVGDRHQAIYGFTGAFSSALTVIQERFNCSILPLTVTFRCSKAATELAKTWVPQITAHSNNKDGSIIEIEGADILTSCRPTPGDAILCRNTKPLIKLALALIREGIPVHVEGRDIGENLGRLVDRQRAENVADLSRKIEEYRRSEMDKLIARQDEYGLEALTDRIDSLVSVMEGCSTVTEVKERIDSLFNLSDDGPNNYSTTVTLSTIHKAKGLEWDRVFLLGFRELQPSRYAKLDWEREQEFNLMYVAVTRTKDQLVITTPLPEKFS